MKKVLLKKGKFYYERSNFFSKVICNNSFLFGDTDKGKLHCYLHEFEKRAYKTMMLADKHHDSDGFRLEISCKLFKIER